MAACEVAVLITDIGDDGVAGGLDLAAGTAFVPSRRLLVCVGPEIRAGPDLVPDRAQIFFGGGALGFEGASRGARRVVMVEDDAAVFRALAASRDALGADAVELRRADALEFLRSDAGAAS